MKALTRRYGTAVAMVLLAIISIGIAGWNWREYNYTSVESLPLNEATRAAVELQLEQSRTIYQICVGLLLGLWGLIIAKREDLHIAFNDLPRLLMFVASNLLLFASLWWHVLYLRALTAGYQVAGATMQSGEAPSIPDVFDPMYHGMFQFQSCFVVAGGTFGVFTLISAVNAHRKRDRNNKN